MNDRARSPLLCPTCRATPWNGGPCVGCGRPASSPDDVLDALGDEPPQGAGTAVAAFYDRRPFPGYAEDDDGPTVLDRAARVPFALALDAAVGPEASVLDLGCGTAQLAAFLALRGAHRTVVGCDFSRGALAEAAAFRRRAGLKSLTLVRADLFRAPFRPRSFDWVLCRGVVHHTADPRSAIIRAAELVAPGGRLVLGWYDHFGRVAHRARVAIARLRGAPINCLDPILRRRDLAPEKREAWIADQYRHPVEARFGLGFVLRAATEAGLGWIRTLPPTGPLDAPLPTPTRARRAALAVRLLCGGASDPDTGLIVSILRRPGSS